jgi:hypothetical protein
MTSSTRPRTLFDLHDLPEEVLERLEELLQRFEEAWAKKDRPSLSDFLAGLSGAERDALLVELVHEELEYRLRAGEEARVEEYLQQFPELHGWPDTVVDLLAVESLYREANGQAASSDEYQERFPKYAELLPARLELLRRQSGTLSLNKPNGDTASKAATVAASPKDGASTLPYLPPARKSSPEAERPPSTYMDIAIPGYEVLGLLGRGGMGIVLEARQLSLGRSVALKIIRDAAYAGEEERRRFRAEAEAIACLQHPNVIQIYDIGEHKGLLYMALEHCSGGSLEKKIGGRPVPAAEAAALVEVLAHGVHAAHLKGVIHRDLKPGNVLLTENGALKITDFGLVKRLNLPGQTSLGAVLGTPSYMAPEQAGGRTNEVGPTTDVYALGAVLYELLTGRPPFRTPNPVDTLLQVLSKETMPPSQLVAGVPPVLEAICLRCLQKAPAHRYPAALELADELRRFQLGQTTEAERSPSAGPVAPLAPPPQQERRPWIGLGLTVGALPGGGRGCALGVTVGVLLLGWLGILWLEPRHWRDQRHSPEAPSGDLAHQRGWPMAVPSVRDGHLRTPEEVIQAVCSWSYAAEAQGGPLIAAGPAMGAIGVAKAVMRPPPALPSPERPPPETHQ